MRNLVFSTNFSLDGFANHDAFSPGEDVLDFFTDLLKSFDVQLFGRKTYELMADYWPVAHLNPNATKGDLSFARRFNAMPKIVFSQSLQKADWNNTRLVHGDAIEEIRKLKQQPGKGLAIGGITLAQSLMKAKLIDEYWLVVHPVICGTGRLLFDGVNERVDLSLVETKKLHSGVIALHYLRKKA